MAERPDLFRDAVGVEDVGLWQDCLGDDLDVEYLAGYVDGGGALGIVESGEGRLLVGGGLREELGESGSRLLVVARELVGPADVEVGLVFHESPCLGDAQAAYGIVGVDGSHGLRGTEIEIDLGVPLGVGDHAREGLARLLILGIVEKGYGGRDFLLARLGGAELREGEQKWYGEG